jgi:hypothetical protein
MYPKSPDRYAMLLFALIELIVLIFALERGNAAVYNIEHNGTAIAYVTMPLGETVLDTKQRLVTQLHMGIAGAGFSLFALLAITAYYTVGGLLLWITRRMEVVNADHTAHRQMSLAPTQGKNSTCYFLLKVLNIAVGALGLVAITLAAAFFGGAVWSVDYLTWAAQADRDAASDAANTASVLSIISLVLKLLEALLGHWWAITLSNKRDHATHIREKDLLHHKDSYVVGI